MKYTILNRLILTSFLLVDSAYASETTFKPISKWTAGDEVKYEITVTRKNVREGEQPSEISVKRTASIRVLQSERSANLHEWRLETEAGAKLSTASDINAKLTEIIGNIRLKIELDENSSIIGIANKEEVRETIKRAVTVLVDNAYESSNDAAQKVHLVKTVESFMKDDATLTHLMTREAQLLYAPIGGEYILGSSRKFKSLLGSPFSSTPVSTDAEVIVSTVNRSTRTFELTLKDSPDSNGINQLVSGFRQQLASATGGKTAKPEDIRMQMQRVAIYEISLDSPWPVTVAWTQSLSAQNRSLTDKIYIRKLPATRRN